MQENETCHVAFHWEVTTAIMILGQGKEEDLAVKKVVLSWIVCRSSSERGKVKFKQFVTFPGAGEAGILAKNLNAASEVS